MESKKDYSRLKGAISWIIMMVGFIGGILFLSAGITGNAIAILASPSSNIIGAVLMIVGFLGASFWSKNKSGKRK